MPTNDERRKVATRLRELDTSRLYDGMDEVYALEDACGCGIGQDWQDMELKDRLAELIEPKPERTCSYVEHSDGVYHYYQCSECQCEMAGWDFELYSPNYCMGCDAKIVKVIRNAD